MGNFEDEIRKKLQEGNLDYNSSSWEKIRENLSSNPPYSPFESEINEKLNGGNIDTPTNAWDEFNDKFNSKSNFERKIKEKLTNDSIKYNNKNWDKLAEKIEYRKLNSYERILKSKLSNVNLKYNPAHWSALEKSIIRTSNLKYVWRGIAALILIFAGFGIKSFSDIKNDKNTVSSQTLRNSSLKELKYPSEGNNFKIIYGNYTTTNNSVKDLRKTSLFESKKESVHLTKNDSSFRTNEKFFNSKKSVHKVVINQESNIGFIVLGNYPLQEYCSSIELFFEKYTSNRKSILSYQIHPGATLWLNFWDNSALTGLYAKSYSSVFHESDWEFIDANKDQLGELKFLQPLNYRAAFEKRLNRYFSLGAYYQYELLKNWNNREGNISISYSKKIKNKFDFKVGLSGSFNSDNLAVNRLTLRERSLNSDYIFSTDLNGLKSKQQQSANLNIGLFLSNKKFYLGYNQNNIASYTSGRENQVTLKKHVFITGVHAPEFKKIRTSILFKYEQELFNSYSPAIGLTYDNRVFTALEYEALSNKKLSIGYQHKRKIKFQLTYSLRDLTQFQNKNMDDFEERKGNLSGGINFAF